MPLEESKMIVNLFLMSCEEKGLIVKNKCKEYIMNNFDWMIKANEKKLLIKLWNKEYSFCFDTIFIIDDEDTLGLITKYKGEVLLQCI